LWERGLHPEFTSQVINRSILEKRSAERYEFAIHLAAEERPVLNDAKCTVVAYSAFTFAHRGVVCSYVLCFSC